ncbi:MAG: hypothetical protein ACXAAI_11850 [Promethearchaeota archaeon]|jgi:hypothetical protein
MTLFVIKRMTFLCVEQSRVVELAKHASTDPYLKAKFKVTNDPDIKPLVNASVMVDEAMCEFTQTFEVLNNEDDVINLAKKIMEYYAANADIIDWDVFTTDDKDKADAALSLKIDKLQSKRDYEPKRERD